MGESIRFLEKEEFSRTVELAKLCFGDEDFDGEYFDRDILSNRVAVKERDGVILSMVHLSERCLHFSGGRSTDAIYILYVATRPEERHKGYMDEVMEFVFEQMRKEKRELTFLVPVDERIYRHLGFLYDWKFNEEERELLYADEGLDKCCAKLICGESFEKPEKITLKSPC